MKKSNVFFVLAIIILLFQSLTVLAGDKVDSFLSLSGTSGVGNFKALSMGHDSSDAAVKTHVFIKAKNEEAVKTLVTEAGGLVHTSQNGIITATIDSSMIDSLAESDDVEFIEGAKPIGLSNDVASLELNVPEAHEGMNLTQGYTGKGVIIGIIDTGIDFTHPDFFDAEGKSRILSIWSQTRTGGPAPAEIQSSYGTECAQSSIADGSCPIKDYEGHGTHVTGTAAGRSDTFGGVAPDANIIVVSYDSSMDLSTGYAETIFSTKICEAAYYIFKKAETLGMPAVINLSLGTHIGAHDGTSLFEQCLAGLTKDNAGRAIVAAAGNEYSVETDYTGIHAGGDVSGTVASNFVIRKVSKDRIYYIDLWGSSGSDLSVGLAINNGKPSGQPVKFSGLIKAGATSDGKLMDGVDYTINFSETTSPLNGKPHAGIRIVLSNKITDMSSYSFDLVVSGTGSFDAWVFPDKPAQTVNFTSVSGRMGGEWTYIAGDRIKSIAIPATSPDIIAVAGYTTRNKWEGGAGCCEITFPLGKILDFSSSGPTAAPDTTGVKPDITAPGGMIASALSSQVQSNGLLTMPDKKHALQAGTSMASPFVTGTIALMFSANPNFTQADVKKYITGSAYVDEAVGQAPNDRWGFGKLDVLAAMETAINGGASGHFDRNEAPGEGANSADSNSSSSGGGCQLTNGEASSASSQIAMFVFALFTLALIVRKRVRAN